MINFWHNSLCFLYFAYFLLGAEDVGCNVNDVQNMGRATRFVSCLPQEIGGSGNPSNPTAQGFFFFFLINKREVEFNWKKLWILLSNTQWLLFFCDKLLYFISIISYFFLGVVRAMEAALAHLGKGDLKGKTVSIQGAGNVASFIIEILLARYLSFFLFYFFPFACLWNKTETKPIHYCSFVV